MPGSPTTVTSCTDGLPLGARGTSPSRSVARARARRTASASQPPAAPNAAARLGGAPDRIGSGLSLRRDRLDVTHVHDRALRRAHRRLVDDHPADGRGRLQPRRGVHDVAGHDPLAALRPRAERDDRLPGRHGRSHRDLESFVAELLDRLEDPERRPHGALGVVLVRDGGAEHGHDGVADELLHRPAEALDVGLHALVVRAQRRADVLGVGAIGATREADEVDEEHRDDLPLLAGRGLVASASRRPGRSVRARGSPRRMTGRRSREGSSQRAAWASTRPAGAARPRPRRAAAAARCARARRRAGGARRRRGRARRPRSPGSGTPPRAGRPGRS